MKALPISLICAAMLTTLSALTSIWRHPQNAAFRAATCDLTARPLKLIKALGRVVIEVTLWDRACSCGVKGH